MYLILSVRFRHVKGLAQDHIASLQWPFYRWLVVFEVGALQRLNFKTMTVIKAQLA